MSWKSISGAGTVSFVEKTNNDPQQMFVVPGTIEMYCHMVATLDGVEYDKWFKLNSRN